MHYTGVIREILKKKRWTYAALANKLGVSRSTVSVVIRENNPKAGMTVANYLRYVQALGGHVYVEWADEGDARRRYRWEIEDESGWRTE